MCVDNSERINSAIGAIGYNKLIKEISQRLLDSTLVDDYFFQPKKEVVLTFMYDRYVLLIEDMYEHKTKALNVANRLQNIFTQPFIIFD